MRMFYLLGVMVLLVSVVGFTSFFSENIAMNAGSLSDASILDEGVTDTFHFRTQAAKREVLLRGRLRQSFLEENKVISGIRAAVDRGEWETALARLEDLVGLKQGSSQELAEVALIYIIEKRQPAGAIPYLKRALEVDPANIAVLDLLTDTYIQLRRGDEGEAYFVLQNSRNPEVQGFDLAIAKICISQERYVDGISFIEAYMLRGGRLENAYALRAQAYQGLESWGAARVDYLRSIALYEKIVAKNVREGKDAKLAAEFLDNLIIDLVAVLRSSGRYEDASRFIAELAERRPDDRRVIGLMEQIFEDHQMTL